MDRGIKLITPRRKNMKSGLMLMEEKLMLRKRSLIETVNDHLKNIWQIEHSRHRSPANFQVHPLASLAAYTRCSQQSPPSDHRSTNRSIGSRRQARAYPNLR